MKNISFSEAASFAAITRDQLRYWIKLLHLKPIKKGRTSFLPNGSEKLLDAMNKAVKGGLSLKDSAREVLDIHVLPIACQERETLESNRTLAERITSLENAVMLLVEQNKSLATINETQSKLFTTNFRRQDQRLNEIQLKLDPLQEAQIENWKPAKSNRPQFSTIQRIWYEITNPEKLRAN